MNKVADVIKDLNRYANPEKAFFLQKYFKTEKGGYGEGDTFIGLKVPDVKKIARHYKDLPLTEVPKLLKHKIHEARLCGLVILCKQYKQNPQAVYEMYIQHIPWINNWDLVDSSAGYIVGPYLEKRNKEILLKMARYENVWERRIAIMSTFHFIWQGEYEWTLKIAKKLLKDKHDLIHKAVGWMLREVGKRCSVKVLTEFLDEYGKLMPRTMLRYAIERLPEPMRKHYLMSTK